MRLFKKQKGMVLQKATQGRARIPNPFPSYVALMYDLVDQETTCFEAVVQKREWVEAMK